MTQTDHDPPIPQVAKMANAASKHFSEDFHTWQRLEGEAQADPKEARRRLFAHFNEERVFVYAVAKRGFGVDLLEYLADPPPPIPPLSEPSKKCVLHCLMLYKSFTECLEGSNAACEAAYRVGKD